VSNFYCSGAGILVSHPHVAALYSAVSHQHTLNSCLDTKRITLHCSTSAMLKVLYADHKAPDQDLSFQEVLLKMRTVLGQGKFEQIPQLSASRPLDIQ
jgi:hypothetical protein